MTTITYRLLVIQLTKREFFDYTSEEKLIVGTIVHVYFGLKKTFGCVWEIPIDAYEGEKKIISFITNIILPPQIIEYIKIFSDYHLCKKHEILKYICQKIPLKYKIKEKTLQNIQGNLSLTPEQENIYHSIKQDYNTHQVSLIFGITGSGKTEIYFKLIEDVLNNGGQALLLLPEIGIISGLKERIIQQLKITPIVWFSGVKTVDGWSRVYRGDNVLVIGARSGIFLPFTNLKLLIVDEEHDMSYKQSNPVSYHGRNISVLLGKIWGIPVVLGSATPSTETYYQVTTKEYHRYRLHKRYGSGLLPKVELIAESNNIINPYCL